MSTQNVLDDLLRSKGFCHPGTKVLLGTLPPIREDVSLNCPFSPSELALLHLLYFEGLGVGTSQAEFDAFDGDKLVGEAHGKLLNALTAEVDFVALHKVLHSLEGSGAVLLRESLLAEVDVDHLFASSSQSSDPLSELIESPFHLGDF